jgi:putative transposase
LVGKAEDWRWGSFSRRRSGEAWLTKRSGWPVESAAATERGWAAWVNGTETEAEVTALRASVKRGRPFGERGWVEKVAARLKLESSLRDPWRPRKQPRGEEEAKAQAKEKGKRKKK